MNQKQKRQRDDRNTREFYKKQREAQLRAGWVHPNTIDLPPIMPRGVYQVRKPNGRAVALGILQSDGSIGWNVSLVPPNCTIKALD